MAVEMNGYTGDWFHVWRRLPDGYINASNTGRQGDWSKTFLSKREGQGTLNGEPVSFEHILSTQDWPMARERIISERSKDHVSDVPAR